MENGWNEKIHKFKDDVGQKWKNKKLNAIFNF